MNIPLSRFCINRKVAPNLTIKQFFELVADYGIHKVELRNDMETEGVIDNLSVAEFYKLTHQYQIEIVSINALYPFNILDNTLKDKANNLIKIAKEIGAKTLVICPLNEELTISDKEKEQLILESINYFNPIFINNNIQGLIEPLGFNQSSLRSFSLINKLITETNSSFKILFDTFHAYLAGIQDIKSENINIENIGLVHISGVDEQIDRNLLEDEHRVMLSDKDILQSKQQIQQLETLGYKGIYSFEPFSSQLKEWTTEDIISAIKTSIDYINE